MRPLPFIAAMAIATSAGAEPYCDALLTGEGLSAKHARSAPIYNNANSGWMFTKDQMRERYDMKAGAAKLVAEIVAEFDKRGVPLAIMVPPPRPVVAGQATLDATMGDDRYDVAAAQASFAKLIEGLNTAGAIAPDLQALSLSNPDLRDAFYFKRDTHWTTVGAAHSAITLARAVGSTHPNLFPDAPEFSATNLTQNGKIEEKGSLARIARDGCGISLGNEVAPTFDLTLASEGGLLGDAPDRQRIALVGSSFSDRYKKDHYRVSDALARVFGADVDNYSVSGGGGIGAIESYVLSGELDQRVHDLVVWELPYTESFNSTSMLRQLLGALRHGNSESGSKLTQSQVIPIDHLYGLKALELQMSGAGNQRVKLSIVFGDGSKANVWLSRRGALSPDARTQSVFVSLADFGARNMTEITLQPSKDTSTREIRLHY